MTKMLTKSEKLWIKSLREAAERRIKGQFIAEGSKVVLELLQNGNSQLEALFASKEWLHKNAARLNNVEAITREIPDSYFKDISIQKTPDPVLAIFKLPRLNNIQPGREEFIFYLDRIRDPGNLGTIIRSADWFGLKRIFISPDSVDPFNNKCVQSSMASILRVETYEVPWTSMREYFPDRPKFSATMKGKSLHELMPEEVGFVCFGNESQGLSKEILEDCEHSLSISAKSSLGAESLNVAIASSIFLAWKFAL